MSLRQSALGWLLGLALLIATGFCQYGFRSINSGATALVPLPPQYVGLSVDPRIVKRLLGVRLLVADLLWIDTLFKADIEKVEHGFSDFYRAFKSIVTLDPDNLYAYYVAGLYMSVIKDDIKGATAILREGVQHMERYPQSKNSWANHWQLPFMLGYNLLFEEHEIEAGSQWISRAADMPNVPQYARDLGKRVSTEHGRLEVASRVLADAYKRMSQPDEKRRIERKMLLVAAKQQLLEMNEKFERFLQTTSAYALPRKRAFRLFINTTGHPAKDLLGRPVGVDSLGRISVLTD